MTKERTERNSNFELMRITSMFMIVIWHFIFHSGILTKTSGILNLFLYFIFITTSIHVNSFVLVSGYFQYNKIFKSKKIVSLITTTWFYKLIYAIVFSVTGIVTITKTEMLFFIQPFNFNYGFGEFYWFINMYIFLYLISPFINKLIETLSQKQHKTLIIILFITLSIVPIFTLNSTLGLSNNGYTLANFVMIYIIGAYFGKYKLKDNYHFKNYSKNKYQLIIIIFFIISIFMSFMAKILSDYFSCYNNELLKYITEIFSKNLTNYASPLILIESILYLLFFETLNIKNKFINKLASLTFGIYLVHENNFVFERLYKHLPIEINGIIYPNVIIKMLLYSIIIFIISAIIEYIRQLISKLITKTKIYKKFINKIENYIKIF